MTTVIVPVDFSETSLNAARYACRFLTGHYGVTIVLFHSFDEESEEDKITTDLEVVKKQLMVDHPVKIEVLAQREVDFITGLERAVHHKAANLVIMGITGKSALAHAFFGSNTLKMVQTKACPVLIVPEHASFSQMKHVMLASDFKDTVNTTPSIPIKEFLSIYRPQLHVVNVDKDHYVTLTTKYEEEKEGLKQLLGEYDPEFYFMRLYDIDEALDMFAKDRNIDLMITVQRNHSFMDKLFKASHTKKLSYHSKMPILVIHE